MQDLQGDILKDKHKEIFKRKIDLLIIDETHFGARAEQYGKVLLPVDDIKAMKHKNDSDDFVEANEADEQIKVLDAKVRLHLSGTPYRILMGSEFTKDDIIAFYQFSNIVDDQEEWNNKYLLNDDYQEWDNPYYTVVWGYNNVTTNETYDYVVHDENASLTRYKGVETEIVIPTMIDGYKVVRFGDIFKNSFF